jgi:Tfp pilus assembly protein PilF
MHNIYLCRNILFALSKAMFSSSSRNVKVLSILGAFAVLIFIYSHHFKNGFQNDDPYFITDNTAIRSLSNIPAIFTDSHTESSLPKFQVQYRPLFILSLATDYAIAGGVSPVVMHIHTFAGFVVLLILCFLLHIKILKHFTQTPFYPALLATCIFAYHPVTADVVNYLTARSNIFGTLYGMLFMVTWLYIPFFRKYHLYLIPLIIGSLFKIIALMFVPLLWLYILYFEYETGFTRNVITALKSSFKTMLPALLTALFAFIFILFKSMPTPEVAKALSGTDLTLSTHLLTQAHVVLRYFLLFFMPENANPYGTHPFITSPFDYHFISGFLFVIISFIIIYLLSFRKSTRVVSYGLAWYFICLIPTSTLIPFPINYVEYYMFSTLIGLSLAMAYAIFAVTNRLKKESVYVTPVIMVGCIFFLSTLAYGSYGRVKIWGNDKAMLEDIISKDPTSGPTLLNLGVYYMGKGKLDSARELFNRAQIYTPDYDLVYLNEGILYSLLKDSAATNANFQKALALNGLHHYQVCYYYASYLHSVHHDKEAMALLSTALQESPSYTDASKMLNDIRSSAPLPSDSVEAVILAKSNPTESDYITLSLSYFNNGKYGKCIEACQKIISLDSNSAVAYNNMCAAYNKLEQWDNAIMAGNKALKIKPDFTLARNNVNFALSQKKK